LHDADLGFDSDGDHLEAAALAVIKLDLDIGVALVIRVSRELIEGETVEVAPIESLCIAAAHWACDIAEDENPLHARTRLQRENDEELSTVVGAKVAAGLREALLSDETWIHFWNEQLPSFAASQIVGEHGPSIEDVIEAASAMRELVDAALREPGRARNVAELASALGR
jgi:hypothetical protein